MYRVKNIFYKNAVQWGTRKHMKERKRQPLKGIRLRLALGEENGTELREVFIDAKDVRQEELSDSEYEEVLLERGREKAADYVKIESIEAEVEDANFIYKKDWDIGDLVTVRKKEWGITLNERVTEVQEVYEDGGMSITPTFGDAFPETLDLSED